MFGIFERMVAMRYLRSRRQEGFISVIAGFSLLGIGLGVATLIIVMSVMNGFRAELVGRILVSTVIYRFIARVRLFRGLMIWPCVSAKSRALLYSRRSLRAGHGYGQRHCVGRFGARFAGQCALSRRIVPDNIIAGSLEEFSAKNGVIMGARLAQRLRVGVGDRITLLSPSTTTTVIGSVPRMRAFPVAALFDVGMYEYDNTFIYMPSRQPRPFSKVAMP